MFCLVVLDWWHPVEVLEVEADEWTLTQVRENLEAGRFMEVPLQGKGEGLLLSTLAELVLLAR